MATKISGLSSATNIGASDLIQVVDVNDTTMAVTGTNKKATAQVVGNNLPVVATGSTTSRKLKDRFADVVNVKDFGAAGDGIQDDTAAIKAAIDSIAAIGGQIVLPSGNYKISSSLNISSQNVFVIGSGRKATKIFQSVASAKVFNVTASYTTISSLSIEYSSQGTAGGAGINIDGAFYCAIDDIYIYKAYIGVDFINGSNSNQLTRVVCEDCTYVGISILNSVNVIASTFQILNSNTTLCSLGCIRMYGPCEGNNFFNGHTYQGAFSLTTDGPSYTMGNRPSYNKFHGVYLDASAGGALIDKTVELDFIDCWFSSRPGNGAYLNEVDGIRFTGGGAINCDQNGVLVESLAKRVIFQNFMARSNSVSSANTYSGIIFAANTTDFVVQGCTATNNIVTFGTQKHGIIVQSGTSNNYVITNNLVSGNATSGVSDGGTGVNKFVSNNF
jgi:hypothetical protein